MQIDRYVADRRRRQKKRRTIFWIIAGFLAVYFASLGIFEFVIHSPAFQAERITVQNNSAVSTAAILDLLHASIVRSGDILSAPNSGLAAMLGFNNLFIWPNALPSSTVAAIPQLDGITISKNYFLHTVTVDVTERQPFAVWCLMPSDNCYWFDNTGIAFERTLDTQGGAITVIHDYSAVAASSTIANTKTPKTLALGAPVLPAEFMPNLISILNVVKQSGMNISNVALNNISLQEIDVSTMDSNGDAGPSLYFSLRFSADEDLSVLRQLTAKSDFYKFHYIDFTVQNRAYYK